MTLNPSIRKATTGAVPSAIASYDYTDIDEGTGFVIFNGSQISGTALAYTLTKAEYYANETSTGSRTTDASVTKLVDADFDVEFNLPKIIKGKALITATIGMYGTGGGGDRNFNLYYTAILKRVDVNGTETTIVTGNSDVIRKVGLGQAEILSKTQAVRLTVPLTYFKQGETLRLTMEVYGESPGNVATEAGIAHDPKDRNNDDVEFKIIEDADTTKLEFHVPFRIDI
jgi:hypothetical protein